MAIYSILGNIGSGKTMSAVRIIITEGESEKIGFGEKGEFSWIPLQKGCTFYCNFKVNSKNCIRLRKDDIIKTIYDEKGKKKYDVNWEYWRKAQKKGNFCIILDEVSNLFHARRSATSWNIAGTNFIQQIRKICQGSKYNHIVLITQRIERLDIAFRDLLHGIVQCELHGDYSVRYHFHGMRNKNVLDAFYRFENGEKSWDFKDAFDIRPYFKYYDSMEIIGESPYL